MTGQCLSENIPGGHFTQRNKPYNLPAMRDEADAERWVFTCAVHKAHGSRSSLSLLLIMIHDHKGALPIMCCHQIVPQVQILDW